MPMAELRRRAGEFLLSRVAGDDHGPRIERIWGTPGERTYGPSDPIWHVNQDPSMYTGGVCALFLQSLHPGPMAAVATYADYQADPWARLQQISFHIAITTFATAEDAEKQFALVRAVHSHINGVDDFGNSYRADDPELLRWVHDAETWSFLTSYQRWGRGHLTDAECDTYVRQSAEGGRRLGATDLPETFAELEAQLEAFRPALACTPAALDVVDFLTHRAPLPAYAKPGYQMVIEGGKSLLPAWARQMLDLPTDSRTRRRQRALGHAATRLVGWALGGAQPSAVSPPGSSSR